MSRFVRKAMVSHEEGHPGGFLHLYEMLSDVEYSKDKDWKISQLVAEHQRGLRTYQQQAEALLTTTLIDIAHTARVSVAKKKKR
ncbi:hypothetical protein HDU86_001597 [Geranomyces michiganensis]|nr:hypothetical protein HDU86_001597 [Geranomyces michiganensis]